MENPATQKDSSTVMNPVRRAGLLILMFGFALLLWSVPAHSESAVVVRVMTRPRFCTNRSERVYMTACGCETDFGGGNGLQAPGAGGL